MKAIWAVVIEDGVRKRKLLLLENRNCEICGEEFEPNKQDSKYCSRKCGKKAYNDRTKKQNNERAKRYRENNLEKVKEKRKAYYWSDPERFRQQTRDYFASRRKQKRKQDSQYKDDIRHGGKRKELLEECDNICGECGNKFPEHMLDAHHSTFDKSDHDNQEILCKSCHTRLHQQSK